MLPQERSLVRQLAGKPFTLLGINSDKDRSVLRKVLEQQQITWPNIYDGSGASAKIAKDWNVSAWPTVYLIDHEGVIRYRDLEDEELQRAVLDLVDKVPQK